MANKGAAEIFGGGRIVNYHVTAEEVHRLQLLGPEPDSDPVMVRDLDQDLLEFLMTREELGLPPLNGEQLT